IFLKLFTQISTENSITDLVSDNIKLNNQCKIDMYRYRFVSVSVSALTFCIGIGIGFGKKVVSVHHY
ncbi:MAG: hypothetical protein AAFP91_18440, partial [Pseudomonadota bacterium]